MAKVLLHSQDIFYTILLVSFICLLILYITKSSNKCSIETLMNNSQDPNSMIKTDTQIDEQIDTLAFSKFKPECCDTSYGNSNGCLCFKDNEYNNIVSRGGNRHLTETDKILENRLKSKIQEKEKQEENRQRGIFVYPKVKVFDIMD